jgi:lysozyme
VDVSTWQKEIDWDRVCGEGISFAFVRATFDGDVVDKYFERNWTECGRIGIYRSPYHFAVPPLSNSKHARQHNPVGGPRDQAEHFYSTVGKLSRDRDLPPVLDMEWHAETISDTAEWCREFLVRTEALFKRTPIIYTSTNFVKNHMGNPRWLRRYLFWQAYWTDASSPPSAIPGFPWTFWQYSNRGEVDGIPTVVDMCRFYGSLDKLQQVAAGRILPPRPLPAAA